MGSGYLTVVKNCLAISRDSKEVTTKNNTYLLGRLPADTSFVWDADTETLTFEEKSYKIADEFHLSGTIFVYANVNITDLIKVNWIDYGLDKGWLGG